VTDGGSSLAEVQRLLAVLAAGRRCAEVGTAFGEGAVAIASTAASLVTVESDPDRAEIAEARLAGLANVELLVGDWREHLPPRAPFGLLFFDGGKLDEAPDALDLLAPGALLVKDDMTPDRPRPDPVRDLLFGHPELAATEIPTSPRRSAIVAVRLRRAP
jgi:predicted O-methyltransferase YrrM